MNTGCCMYFLCKSPAINLILFFVRVLNHSEDPEVEEDNIKMDLQGVGCGAWTGSIWLRIGTGGRLL